MTAAQRMDVRAFIASAPWARGRVTVWLLDEAITPECMPRGVRVVEVGWWRRSASGLVPVVLRKGRRGG